MKNPFALIYVILGVWVSGFFWGCNASPVTEENYEGQRDKLVRELLELVKKLKRKDIKQSSPQDMKSESPPSLIQAYVGTASGEDSVGIY